MTIPQAVRNNESLMNPMVSDQCFLIEKAKEIYDYFIQSNNNAQFMQDSYFTKKKIVRQVGGDGTSAIFTYASYKDGRWTYGNINNATDNSMWGTMWQLQSNFEYIKLQSFGGWVNWKGDWTSSMRSPSIPGAGHNTRPKVEDINYFHPFFEITPAEKAQISHFCDVGVAYYQENGKLKEQEAGDDPTTPYSQTIPFNQNENDLSYLTKPAAIKNLAGLQTVTITHEGVDSLTRNMVLVNATYIFQDLRKLVEEPYTQLLQVGNYLAASKLYRYIEFNLGWDTSNPDLKGRLNLDRLRMRVKTNLIKYTFDLKDDGSIIVNAQYRGHIVDMANNANSNILQLAKSVFEEIKHNTGSINATARQRADRLHAVIKEQLAKNLATNIFRELLLAESNQFFAKVTTGWIAGSAMFPLKEIPVGGRVYPPHVPGHGGPVSPMLPYQIMSAQVATNRLTTLRTQFESEFLARIAATSMSISEKNDATAQFRLKLAGFFDGTGVSNVGMNQIIRTSVTPGGSPSGAAQMNQPVGNLFPHVTTSSAHDIMRQHNFFRDLKATFNEYTDYLSSGGTAVGDFAAQNKAVVDKQAADLKALEDSLTNVYRGAVSTAMKAAYTARYQSLKFIAKQLLTKMKVYNIYIEKSKRVDIKEASIDPNKTRMLSLINGMKPNDYLNVKTPSKIKEKWVDIAGDTRRLSAGKYEEAKQFTDKDLEEYQIIPFIFLGDLLTAVLTIPADLRPLADPANTASTIPNDTVIDRIIKSNNNRRFYTDLGFLSYNTPFTNLPVKDLRLYYYPISLKRLNDFFAREVIGKERSFYSYLDLCQGLIRKFFDNSFTSCSREAHMQDFVSPKIRMALYEDEPTDTFPGSTHIFIYGSKNVASDLAQEEITTNSAGASRSGTYDANMMHGIYHFYLGGLSRGMTMKVKVIDIADPSTKTAVYFNAGRSSERANAEGNAENQGSWAPVIFQANIETLGYPMFELGNLIYVDLRPFVTAEHQNSRQFAANGYYGIKKISYNWSAEKFTTNIESIIQLSDSDVAALNAAGGSPVHTVSTGGASVITLEMIRTRIDAVKTTMKSYETLRETTVEEAEKLVDAINSGSLLPPT